MCLSASQGAIKLSEALTNIFVELCRARAQTVEHHIPERGLLKLLDSCYALPLRDMDIGRMPRILLPLLLEHNLRLPKDVVIMIKSLAAEEVAARLVMRELNVVEELKGSYHRVVPEHCKPGVVCWSLKNSFSRLLSLKSRLLQQIPQIIEKIEGGELSVKFHLEKLENLVNTLKNVSNRLIICFLWCLDCGL